MFRMIELYRSCIEHQKNVFLKNCNILFTIIFMISNSYRTYKNFFIWIQRFIYCNIFHERNNRTKSIFRHTISLTKCNRYEYDENFTESSDAIIFFYSFIYLFVTFSMTHSRSMTLPTSTWCSPDLLPWIVASGITICRLTKCDISPALLEIWNKT